MSIMYFQLFLDGILLMSSTLMLVLSPYTKVEESFNVQAIHDILNIGIDQIELFDHLSFPGVVKRTCISAILFSLPLVYFVNSSKRWSGCLIYLTLVVNSILPTNFSSYDDLNSILNETKIHQLLLSRFFLSLCTSFSMIYLRKSMLNSCSKNSKLISIWFSLLFYPLPHILYYSSRFLPNFICFPITNVAIGMFLDGDISRSIAILIFVGIVFRFEVLIFALIIAFFCTSGVLRNGKPLLKLREFIIPAIISTGLSCFLTCKIDSYFWDVEYILPEFESFFFNVISGKSSEWGIEPPYAYFSKYLPRIFASGFEVILLLTTVFVSLSLLNIKSVFFNNYKSTYRVDYINYGIGTITTLLWSAIAYILVLSINGHKEWRFLVYTIPIFCLVSSCTFEFIFIKANKMFQKLLLLAILITYISGLCSSFIFGFISSWNYTGGVAAQLLNLRLLKLYESQNNMLFPVTIHWDVGTCMNGASLFTQIGNNKAFSDAWIDQTNFDYEKYWIIYDKTENPIELQENVDTFNYWIQYDDEEMLDFNNENYEWVLIDIVEGYVGLNYDMIFKILKNPTHIIHQAISLNYTYFYNLLNDLMKRDVRAKIWERYNKETLI